MKRLSLFLLLFAIIFQVRADEALALHAQTLKPLPMRLSNNAVTSVASGDRQYIVSFAGLGEGLSHDDTLSVTFVFDAENGAWRDAPPLPGGVGRLATTASSIGGLAYVFGGYTVAADGAEISTPWVHSFDPVSGEFRERASMPVPVDDAVAVVYQGRYIYLISGWHDLGNVNLTQRYDTESDSWAQATPIPGSAVFGHAGGIVGNRMFYCDGVAVRPHADRSRDFVASDACFLGIIDEEDSRRIDWRTVSAHPGLPRYRMASAGVASRKAVLFLGGSENPYNYNGIGYDGEPSAPVASALLFDLEALTWLELPQSNAASMDHRGLVPLDDRWLTIGGMLAGQRVTDQVIAYEIQ